MFMFVHASFNKHLTRHLRYHQEDQKHSATNLPIFILHTAVKQTWKINKNQRMVRSLRLAVRFAFALSKGIVKD